MSLKDVFKKKKGKKEKKEEKKQKKSKKKKAKKKQTLSKERKQISKKIAPDVLYSPHITEKATDLTEFNQYVFKVYDDANKPEIKKAVEEAYDVDVVKVNTINSPSKPRRIRGEVGRKKGYKKAIVKLKEGQSIDISPR